MTPPDGQDDHVGRIAWLPGGDAPEIHEVTDTASSVVTNGRASLDAAFRTTEFVMPAVAVEPATFEADFLRAFEGIGRELEALQAIQESGEVRLTAIGVMRARILSGELTTTAAESAMPGTMAELAQARPFYVSNVCQGTDKAFHTALTDGLKKPLDMERAIALALRTHAFLERMIDFIFPDTELAGTVSREGNPHRNLLARGLRVYIRLLNDLVNSFPRLSDIPSEPFSELIAIAEKNASMMTSLDPEMIYEFTDLNDSAQKSLQALQQTHSELTEFVRGATQLPPQTLKE